MLTKFDQSNSFFCHSKFQNMLSLFLRLIEKEESRVESCSSQTKQCNNVPIYSRKPKSFLLFLSYNLMPRDMAKCRRRIRLENIASATFSTSSTEFAIHVPEEYDYRFKAVHTSLFSVFNETFFFCFILRSIRNKWES